MLHVAQQGSLRQACDHACGVRSTCQLCLFDHAYGRWVSAQLASGLYKVAVVLTNMVSPLAVPPPGTALGVALSPAEADYVLHCRSKAAALGILHLHTGDGFGLRT